MPKGDGKGGARKGAGRPRKAEKYAAPIAAAEDRIARKDRLLALIDNLFHLADGGYRRVREQWEPAGLVMRDVPAEDADGNPVYGPSGAPMMTKVPAFPDLDPGEMVCVSRTTEAADKDRAANEYLINRILGRPTQAVEVSGEDGKPVETVVFYLPRNGRDTPHGEGSGDVAG